MGRISMRNKSCQATVEYLLVITAIILALIAAVNGSIRDGLNNYYDKLGSKVSNIIDDG